MSHNNCFVFKTKTGCVVFGNKLRAACYARSIVLGEMAERDFALKVFIEFENGGETRQKFEISLKELVRMANDSESQIENLLRAWNAVCQRNRFEFFEAKLCLNDDT